MDITKLTPNIEAIVSKYLDKRSARVVMTDIADDSVTMLLDFVVQYKKWALWISNYLKDITLQNLPLDYYQICARQYQALYEKNVEIAIPKLLALGIIDKNGNLI